MASLISRDIRLDSALLHSTKAKTMENLTIRTNNHWREFLDWCELTNKEREWFDYQDEDSGGMFFRYRGICYDLGRFERCPDTSEAFNTHANNLADWHGYASDSFFSGVCIRFNRECDAIQVGTYYS